MCADLTSQIPKPHNIPVFAHAQDASPMLTAGCILCVGTFDGVHRGHQAILGEGLAIAIESGLPLWVLTFHPHPRTVIRGEPVQLLTLPEERIALLAHFGTAGIVMQEFDKDFAARSATDFRDHILAASMNAKVIICGADFRYGRNAEGDVAALSEWAKTSGRAVLVLALLEEGEGGQKISSGAVRKAMGKSQFDRVIELLGHPYPATGELVSGLGKGKDLGYPTWNLSLPQVKLAPPVGVYAGWTDRQTPQPGMAYYGSNPTFGGQNHHLEINLLAGSQEDRKPRHPSECFWLTEYIRPEVVFNNPDELKKQLADDEREVRKRLGV